MKWMTLWKGARAGALAAALALGACAGTNQGSEHAEANTGAAVEVPLAPARALRPRVKVASGLANPRGMHLNGDGTLLLSTAGTGEPASGALLRLHDNDGDGDYDDEGERTTLLDKQPSRNLFGIVRRDEVFGLAGIAEGAGSVLVSLADFGGPSKIFQVDGPKVTPWGSTHGNINDLAFDVRRGVWVGVSSTTDEIVQIKPGGGADRVVKFPPLASGQDAVPAYLRFDPRSGDVLVTLFSGSPEGEEGGEGTELVPRSASIVRVHAETRKVTPVVTGLTVPSDLEIDEDGSIYVLEFCDSFLDPVERAEDMQGGAMHGGFKRFSGRLLHISRDSGAVQVVADGLDAPTNLTRSGGSLYIAQGMGTPGRLIPGPDGKPVPLTGFIERIALR
jgi:hypothetical protein